MPYTCHIVFHITHSKSTPVISNICHLLLLSKAYIGYAHLLKTAYIKCYHMDQFFIIFTITAHTHTYMKVLPWQSEISNVMT